MCKYECVRRASKRLNFREVGDDDDWTIYWTDTSVGIDRVAQMKKWQVSVDGESLGCIDSLNFVENQSFSRHE